MNGNLTHIELRIYCRTFLNILEKYSGKIGNILKITSVF